MEPLPLRLLLNAEPFGFGPTAAIAGFFPHLRPHFATIGYMGKKHTLDLQKDLPYDAIHDVSATPKQERARTYAPIFAQYDILFTAMDHKIADYAQKAGLLVFYYDALTWYWPSIPKSVLASDLYLAQDFFGVKERMEALFAACANAHTVPMITPRPDRNTRKDHVLINLGGLQNPYWPLDEVVAYARSFIEVLRESLPADEKLVIAASAGVAKHLTDLGVKTYLRADMEDILARSKLAFMTPGLGNIHDAAAHDLPTLWLPPANDSQGQQLVMMEGRKMVDGVIHWHDIVPGMRIDYHRNQPVVLEQIAKIATRLANEPSLRTNLVRIVTEKIGALKDVEHSKTAGLADLFGSDGVKDVAHHIVEKARDEAKNDHYLALAGDLTVRLNTHHDLKGDEQAQLQMGAYVPGFTLLDQPVINPDITIRHIASDTPGLEVSKSHIVLRTPESDGLPTDLYYLLYGVERRELLKRDFYTAHAACVGKDGDYILIVGPSGAGKTTLADNLVKKHGWKLFSGNKTVVHFESDGSMTAVAGTKTMTALDQSMSRYAYKLPVTDYAPQQEVRINAIAIVRVNDGVKEVQTLTDPSALHTLYPSLMDAVNADVIVNRTTIFDGDPSDKSKQKLVEGLGQALRTIPVRKISGPMSFMEDRVSHLLL